MSPSSVPTRKRWSAEGLNPTAVPEPERVCEGGGCVRGGKMQVLKSVTTLV